MGNSLAYQERCGGHSTNSARGNLPGLAQAIRTGHQAKLHERLSSWREIRGAGAVGYGGVQQPARTTRPKTCHNLGDLKGHRAGHVPPRIWHIPARLARHARQRVLKLSPDEPVEGAFFRLLGAAVRRAASANLGLIRS